MTGMQGGAPMAGAPTHGGNGAVISVLVAESHALFRAALSVGLDAEADMSVVASVGNGGEAVDEIVRLDPDVAVIAAGLGPRSGVDLCSSLRAAEVGTRLLVMSQEADPTVLLASVEAGADGYLDRTSDLSGLVEAIRRVHAGEACIPPPMLATLLRHLVRRRRDDDWAVDRFSRLSRREREVFALLTQGKDNRAIAERLVVSPHTARTHIQNVLEKLGVHSRLEATSIACQYQLIERFGVTR